MAEDDTVADAGPTTEMTVAEVRDWLRDWVAGATGRPAEQITVDRPMEEFGLASRDAIALGGDIEDLTGVELPATVVFQHPTIASLAERIVNGEPEPVAQTVDDSYYLSAPAGDAHDVAIVGLSTRFPGAGETPESTWDFLIGGGNGISDLPEGRWAEFTSEPAFAEAVAKGHTRGGYLDDVKGFDAEFFAISGTEAEQVDPQQRLALELAWEALEHARIPASSLKGGAVGVFVGTSSHDFTLLSALNPKMGDTPFALTGAATSIVANRVSYFYDFRGPSVAVDTACSSALVAVHQAVRALRGGEADVALAGGVNTLIAPMVTLGFDSLGAVAPDGHIKAFSKDADGMVRSEGGGLFVLKRLADAERDGDSILAVIKGSAVNSDGRSNGIFAPNPDAQAAVLRAAYRDAGIVPSAVDYIEAHGTGTIIGDPIEADALGRVVGRGRDADRPALLGSAKTNFGHLESGAGAPALAKVVLSMQADTLPPSLNYAGPNPYIDFDAAHLRVIPEATDWPRYSGTATAGVSGFGFGGTNAHVVVQEYRPETTAEPSGDAAEPSDAAQPVEAAAVEPVVEVPERETPLPVLLAVSAYVPSRRRRAAAELADWLETERGSVTPLADVARSLARRNHGRTRSVVLATTHAEAITGLRAIANGKAHPTVFSADQPAVAGPVWVLSGFGAQHRKMCKQLYLANPVFRAAVDEVDELIQDEAGYSVTELYLDDARDWDVGTSQVGIFACQVGLAALLRHYGAQPAAVVGHSLGEVAGAYISGGLDLVDAVRVICSRSRLMGEADAMISDADIRRMVVVEYSVDQINDVLTEFPDLEIAVYAAPTHTVVGGPEAQAQALVARAEAEGKLARVLAAKGAGHTSHVDPLLGELAAELAGIEPRPLTCGLYSTVDKETYYKAGHAPVHTEDYWVRNMRTSVWFTQAVRLAVESGHTTFVELAPHSVALMQVAGTTFAAGLHDGVLIPTLERKKDEEAGVLAALAQLYVAGQDVDLAALAGPGAYAPIPRTTFVRKPHWIDSRMSVSGDARMPGAHVALPDGRHAWEVQASAVTDPGALVTAAAGQVLTDVTLGISVPHGPVPATGTLTTTLTPHLGGASVQVHAGDGGTFRLLYDAVVTAAVPAAPAAPVAEVAPVVAEQPADLVVADTFGGRWNPDGPLSAEDRLAEIVAESMGYAVEDIPREIPLIELGLDSLMAVRIKNRVEYEFDIPNLQLQAVREANLIDVGKYLRYAIEHREEVQALADQQAAEKAAAEQAEQAAEAGPTGVAEQALSGVAEAAPTGVAEQAEVAAEEAENEQALSAEDTSVVAAAERITEQAAATEQAAVTEQAAAEQAAGAEQAAVTEQAAEPVAGGSGISPGESYVPPRDPAERLTFATWAVVTGESAKGVLNTLPILAEEVAERLAERLSDRAKGEITVDDVQDAETIEQLADQVRNLLEGSGLDGFVRTLRGREQDSEAVPVFVFHPSGSTTTVYEPLLKRLPANTPMYGFERVDGEIEERAKQYLPALRKLQGDGPYVLYGWSLGGVLALTVAKLLRAEGADVRLVGMIDLALPVERPADGPEANRERFERYASFAARTYGIDESAIPVDQLAAASDAEQVRIITDLIKMSGANVPVSMIEHERQSWIDSRALANVEATTYDGKAVLYLADRYHDGMIELEPVYKHRAPNGGWDGYIDDLEIIQIGGDHVQIVDEPYVATIGADLTRRLAEVNL